MNKLSMTIDPTSGEDMERRVARVEFAEGAFTRLRVPVKIEAEPGRDVLTDIDVANGEGVAREIRRFRDMPAEGRLEVARRGREHVTTRFPLSAMHAGYDEVYAELARLDAPSTRVP